MALKLHNKKGWYPIIFLIGSAIVTATWFHWKDYQHPEVLLSGIGAVGGLTYFLYHQHLDETKLFKDLFVEFNARYDKLNDGLNTIALGPREGELSVAERKLLFSYFNLCAEEYFFYKAGYLDDLVWKSWQRGMEFFFEHSLIRALWDSEAGADYYYGFHPG